jgi:hypothetical protein
LHLLVVFFAASPPSSSRSSSSSSSSCSFLPRRLSAAGRVGSFAFLATLHRTPRPSLLRHIFLRGLAFTALRRKRVEKRGK